MNTSDRFPICDPNLPVDTERPRFTMPLLTRAQYAGTPERPADYSRALRLADDCLQEFFSSRYYRGGRGLSDLGMSEKPQLLRNIAEHLRLPSGASGEAVFSNIQNAVFYATELWEIALVITPYLLPETGASETEPLSELIRSSRHRMRL